MSYTPDILIQKESFINAFKEAYNGLLPDWMKTEEIITYKVTQRLIRTKEFRGFSKLKKQRDEFKSNAEFGVSKTLGLSDKEKQLIVEKRLENNKDYQELSKKIDGLEKKLKEKINWSPEIVTLREIIDTYKCDSTVTIEGKEYYWVITETSAVAHALCDWLEENNVTYVPSYER